jgi:iron complex transport system permease protein
MYYAVSQVNRLRHYRGTAYLLAFALCICCMLVAIVVGSVAIPLATVITVLWHWLRHIPETTVPDNLVTIITTIRLPRVVMVTCAGAALGGAGAAYQGLFRNPSPIPMSLASHRAPGLALSVPWQLGELLPLRGI